MQDFSDAFTRHVGAISLGFTQTWLPFDCYIETFQEQEATDLLDIRYQVCEATNIENITIKKNLITH